MKTTLYMMRHGESVANAMRVFLGHGDLDLTKTGHAQAERTAKYLKGIPCDAIYASDLLRAFHTAEHTACAVGLPVIPAPQLREIDAGKWDGMAFDDIGIVYPEEYAAWRTDVGNARPVGGESVEELQRRIVAAVAAIAEAHKGQTVFLFSHATPVRAMAAHSLGKTKDEMKTIPWASNASVTRFSYENGAFLLEEYGYDAFMEDLSTKLPANV